ncbi:MAG: thiamine-phosphate synthase family protein [Candidatus Thorarchaeota archaeon]
MRPPCEIVQREFLPDLRASLSRILKERGLSQMEIAERIGLTQAAVSKYLRQSDRTRSIDRHIHVLATRIAQDLLDDSKTQSQILKQVCGTCMTLRIGSDICTLHKRSHAVLAEEECTICSELLGGSDQELTSRSEVIGDLQEALDTIESSNTFSYLVPEVRANLVSCLKEARALSDVAGIPGRITLIEGRARAFLGPQFGASKHTASLLLNIREKWSYYRACLCISGKDSIIVASEQEGVNVIHLKDAQNDVNVIAAAVFELLKSRPKGFLGINVPGGIGVEPILYIFGKSAIDLAKLSNRIGIHVN